MARAVAFGLGWVLAAGIVGGLLGSIATGIPGLVIWSVSGIAIGAAQWALVCRRLQVSPIRWIAATAIGSFVTILVHLYLGILISKSLSGFPDFTTAIGREFLLDSIVVALVGGLTLGVPQALVLEDTTVRWWAWIAATTLGVLAAWLVDLALLNPVVRRLPREVAMIAHVGGYWVALSLPQAILIGRAMKSTTPALLS